MAIGAGAIRAGRAFVELFADDSRLNQALNRARNKLKAFGASVSQAGKSMMTGAAAMAAPGVLMAKTFSSFEQQMARVKAISNATAPEFAAMWKEAKRLGETTVFMASDAAEAMGNFALAGFTVKEILGATAPTLNMAAAGSLGMAEAADITAKIMRSMQVPVEQLGYAVDVLTKGMTTANTDLRMLGEAFKYVGPMAAGVNKGIEEMTASIMHLSDAGIQADMAGTTMRGTLLTLADAKDQAKLRELGVEVLDAAGNMRHLADIVDDTNKALEGAGSGSKLGVIGEIFDARQAAGFVRLLTVGGQKLRETEAMLKQSAGTGQRIATQMLDTVHGDTKILESVIEAFALTFTETFTAKIREGIRWVTGLVTSMSEWVRENRTLVGNLATLGMKVAAVALTLGAVFFIGGKLISVAGTAIGVLSKLRVVMFTIAMSPLGLALVATTAAIVALSGASSDATLKARELADATEALRAKGDENRKTDQLRLERLSQLAEKQQKSNEEVKEAADLVEHLNKAYDGLGLSIDTATGKIDGMTGATERLIAAQRKQAAEQLQAEIDALTDRDAALAAKFKNRGLGAVITQDLFGIGGQEDEEREVRDKLARANRRMRALRGGDAAAITGEGSAAKGELQDKIAKDNEQKARSLELEAAARSEAKEAAEELTKLEDAAHKRKLDQFERDRTEARQTAAERRKLLGAIEAGERQQKGGARPEVLADVARRRRQVEVDLARELADIGKAEAAERRRADEEHKRQVEEVNRLTAEGNERARAHEDYVLDVERQIAEAEGDRAAAARYAAEQFRRSEFARLDGLGLSPEESAQAMRLIDRLAAARQQLDQTARDNEGRDFGADLDRQLAEQRGDKAALARMDAERFRREQLERLKGLDLSGDRRAAALAKIDRVAAGLEQQAANQRSIRGTFNAAALQGLQTSTPEKETAANTREMRQTLEWFRQHFSGAVRLFA